MDEVDGSFRLGANTAGSMEELLVLLQQPGGVELVDGAWLPPLTVPLRPKNEDQRTEI